MKTGIALSGGGARGIAHLGVIKALEDRNYTISMISGTSAGAIIGAFYASGYSTEEILDIIIHTKLFKVVRLAISKKGILNFNRLEKIYRKYFPSNSFENLKMPLVIAATDVSLGKTRFFSEGELIKPILASSCIPVIFKPVEFENTIYVDGGLLNNLPVEPLKEYCEYIIGSHCNPITPSFDFGNMKLILERSMLITISDNVRQRKTECNIFIEPPELANYGGFDVAKAKDLFQIGYDYTLAYIK